MSTHHTPGPWTVEGVNIYAPAPATVRKHIAKVIYGDAPDAHLIAAAPDLLAALSALLEWGRTHTSPTEKNSPHTMLVAAHNAIAKATGTAH